MTGTTQYFLDTNVLLAYIRAGHLGQFIEKKYNLQALPFKPLICAVTIGEIKAIAAGRAWGEAKIKLMEQVFAKVVKIEIGDPEVTDAYALAKNALPNGIGIPQNDLWIAAATIAAQARLLTTDKHFDYLAEQGKITREWIDPKFGRPT